MIRALGFMPGAFTGRTRLGYATGSPGYGLGDLGDIQGDAATIVALGIADQGTVDTLLAEGATDEDLSNLINGLIDVPTLMNNLTRKPFAAQAGISMNYEPTDWVGFGVEEALGSLDADIAQLETWAHESFAVQTQLGTQIAAARAQWNTWHGQYQEWINETDAPVIVTMPDGSRLITDRVYEAGLNPLIIVAAGTVVALAAAIAYYHSQTVKGLIEQAKAIMAQTGMQAQAATQAAATAAAGQPGVAIEIAKIGQKPAGTQPQPPGTTDWKSWLQANTGLVVGALLVIFVAPPLLQAVGGRKR